MNCPTCGAATKRIKVHDENPFYFSECVDCGWDDYEDQERLNREMLIFQRDELNDDMDYDHPDPIEDDYTEESFP